MSFFTNLCYYRPCSPPPVTADDLSRFIARIRDTGLLTSTGVLALEVKFGDSIDQDDRNAAWLEEEIPRISVIKEIEWDIDLFTPPTLQDVIDILDSDQRRIYRAAVMLGMPTEDVLRPITRENSSENEIVFCPDGLSIEIGPIECYNLVSEQPLHVGWISLDLSGSGYLFPWTFRDVLERLEGSGEIDRLTNVCRSFWPVPSERPEPPIIKLRKQFPELLPFDEIDQPWDWYWGLQESG